MGSSPQGDDLNDSSRNVEDNAEKRSPNPQVRVNYRGTPSVRPTDIHESKAGQVEIRKNLQSSSGE